MDACHLRGFLKEQILTVVGINGNDVMYPIAFTIYESENRQSWGWFLEQFMRDIDSQEKINWTFISYQQKVSQLCISCLLYNLLICISC